MKQLEIFKGDSLSLKVIITNQVTGELFDLTGYTAKLTVKANERDSDHLLQVEVTEIENPTEGIVVIDLAPEKTELLEAKNCPWDIEISNNDRSKVYTVEYGVLKVKQDITN